MYKPLRRVIALIFTNFRTNLFNLLVLCIGIVFCAVMGWSIYRLPFVRKTRLANKEIILLIALKIAVALVFAMLVEDNKLAGDYSFNNNLGIQEFEILKTNPTLFLTDFGQNNNQELGELFSAEKSFWDDLAGNIMAKTLAIFNLFTQGNFYLNAVLFSLLGFLASVALYRVGINHGYSKPATLICSFFLISCLGFTAAIHKDTIVFFAMATSIFQICRLSNGWKPKNVVYLLLTMLLLFSMRNYIVVCFIPAALIYMWSKNNCLSKVSILVFASLACLVLASQYLSPNKNLSTILTIRQGQYLALSKGGSDLGITPLDNNLSSVFANLPEAIWNVSMSPLQLLSSNPILIFWSVEISIYLLVILFGTYLFITKKYKIEMRLALFYWTISIAAFLIIGLIVPNAGAITRYRAIFLPIFLLPFLEKVYLHIKYRNI